MLLRIEFPKITSTGQPITFTLKPQSGHKLQVLGDLEGLLSTHKRELSLQRNYGPILSFVGPMKIESDAFSKPFPPKPEAEMVFTVVPGKTGMLVASGIVNVFSFLELVEGDLEIIDSLGTRVLVSERKSDALDYIEELFKRGNQ